MRKFAFIVLAALTLGACNEDAVAPADFALDLDELADLAFSGAFAADPRGNFLGPLHRLPDHLKLSATQEAQIKTLIEAFVESVKADRDALAAIMLEARAAAQAGKSREEIKAILDSGIEIHRRLHQAEAGLRTDILGVLTTDQKAWLEANQPTRCTASPLTEEQKTQIGGLIAAFEQANKSDLDAIKAAFEEARAAQRSGASREAIRAILESVRPAMERVAAAQRGLRASIDALLTPEQRACHGMPGPRPQHRPGP